MEAIKYLGWKGVDVYRINTSDDIDKLSKAIAENIHRKQLTPEEEVMAIDELHKLQCEKYGKAEKYSHPKASSQSEHGWSIEKTAKLLGRTKGHIAEDLQLAKGYKKHPELAKKKNKTQDTRSNSPCSGLYRPYLYNGDLCFIVADEK